MNIFCNENCSSMYVIKGDPDEPDSETNNGDSEENSSGNEHVVNISTQLRTCSIPRNYFGKSWIRSKGMFTLTESETETDKKCLHMIAWWCSLCTETDTNTDPILLTSVSVSVICFCPDRGRGGKGAMSSPRPVKIVIKKMAAKGEYIDFKFLAHPLPAAGSAT